MKSFIAVLTVFIACVSSEALGQEPTNTPAAVIPGKGRFTFQQLLKYKKFSREEAVNSRDIRDFQTISKMAYGITRDSAISLDLPVFFRATDINFSTDREEGLGDATVMLTKRFYQNDFGAVNTSRAAWMAGLELPTGDAPFGSDSVDPIIGAAWTHIEERNGYNLAGRYKFNTDGRYRPVTAGDSSADILYLDAAWLYRLFPGEWQADSTYAWYSMLELNGTYETNGDSEVFISPGLLYEANHIAWEVSVQLPILQELNNRPKADYAILLGVRFIF